MKLRSVSVTCGNNITEIVGPHQPSRLTMNKDVLKPGCIIHWRIAIHVIMKFIYQILIFFCLSDMSEKSYT